MDWIRDLPGRIGERVELRAWLAKKRSSGKIGFLQLRDGSGVIQAVASRGD
ncbi:MAG: OB-fold nucleic acid binding domain-containing protein, partial [Thermoanaerobaculia bacterium]